MRDDEVPEDAEVSGDAELARVPAPTSNHWWVRARLRAVYGLLRLLRIGDRR